MSISNIEQFLQNGLNLNGARPSRFMCSISPPTGINFKTGQDKFQFSCRAASIPAFEVGVVNVGYFGRVLKYSGDRTWQDWEVSVLLDQDYATRDLFEIWSNGINKLEDNTLDASLTPSGGIAGTVTPYGGYKGTIDIIHFSQYGDGSALGTPIASYTLIGAWPANIGPIQLNWNQQNAISEFSVRFAFDNCIQNTIFYNPGFQK